MADPNIDLLTQVVQALGELRDRMTFVGGCATGLLITDPAASPVRATLILEGSPALRAPIVLQRLRRIAELRN